MVRLSAFASTKISPHRTDNYYILSLTDLLQRTLRTLKALKCRRICRLYTSVPPPQPPPFHDASYTPSNDSPHIPFPLPLRTTTSRRSPNDTPFTANAQIVTPQRCSATETLCLFKAPSPPTFTLQAASARTNLHRTYPRIFLRLQDCEWTVHKQRFLSLKMCALRGKKSLWTACRHGAKSRRSQATKWK